MKSLFIALLLAFVLPAPAAAGSLVYSKDGKLWLRGDDGAGEAFELAPAPSEHAITRIRSNLDATTIAVESMERWYLLALKKKERIRALDCQGDLAMDPEGRCLLCNGPSSVLFYLTAPSFRKTVLGFTSSGVQWIRRGRILVARATGLWSASVNGTRRFQLAPHVTDSFSISPDGTRALAVIGEKPNRGLYSFALNGKATKRKLLEYGEAIGWSMDSEWVLVRQNKRGCVIRATGGQYKCWEGFNAAALSGDGGRVFLWKPDSEKHEEINLYSASTRGSKTERPTLISRNVSPAATWVPINTVAAEPR